MAQPLLTRLREKRPDMAIDVLAPPWVAPVLRRMAEVDEVIETRLVHGALQLRERWRLGRSLRARGYSQAIVLPNTWKSALLPFFADIPLRSGYPGESRYGLLNLLYRSTYRATRGEPMSLHYTRLSEAPGTLPALQLPQPSLQSDRAKAARAAAKFGVPERYTVFCPGAEFGPAKRWPYFAQLAHKMDSAVVLLGSAADAEACAGIAGINLAGKTTLDEAIDLIAGAERVVSNDSGLMHVAAALARPQVALFGSSSPEHTPPQSSAARVLWLKIECSPCFQRTCPLGHFRCMRDLSAERVLDELATLP
jgi:heptosyltransferase II